MKKTTVKIVVCSLVAALLLAGIGHTVKSAVEPAQSSLCILEYEKVSC